MIGNINQNIQRIEELMQNGIYDDAEKMVINLQSEIFNNVANLQSMQLSELHSIKNRIDDLSELAESVYVKEVAKIRTRRIARMLYNCKDLTE
jgi:spore maturation protein CgeB